MAQKDIVPLFSFPLGSHLFKIQFLPVGVSKPWVTYNFGKLLFMELLKAVITNYELVIAVTNKKSDTFPSTIYYSKPWEQGCHLYCNLATAILKKSVEVKSRLRTPRGYSNIRGVHAFCQVANTSLVDSARRAQEKVTLDY